MAKKFIEIIITVPLKKDTFFFQNKYIKSRNKSNRFKCTVIWICLTKISVYAFCITVKPLKQFLYTCHKLKILVDESSF